MSPRHILVTTDFSEESLRALAPAADLAREIGGRVTILFVMPQLVAAPYGAPYVPPVPVVDLAERLAETGRHLEQLKARVGAGVEVRTEVVSTEQRVADAICAYARTHGVDLIAMSTHGRSGMRRLFVGSVVENVIRTSSLPVIVFPPAH
jgi:nucleotide-binding universal stress UspA family protein